MTTVDADVGGANERTALSWQRTALSLVAAAAAMARLSAADLGAAAAIPLGVAVLISGWVFIESRGRYRHDAGIRSRRRSRGGRAPFAVMLAIVLLAGTELVALCVS